MIAALLILVAVLAGCADAGDEPMTTPRCTKEVDIVCTVTDGLRSCRAVTVCR